jgi:HEAT repeat protein
LPADTTKITVNGTQIKGEPAATSVEDLLSLLEADDPSQADSSSIPEDLKLQTDPKARQAQIDRLERLVRGSQSWQARRVAARLLGQSDELRVVPALIFALSDPDTKVKQYANDGLCFISRKFDGFGFPAKPNSDEVRQAQNRWREWFLSIKPGYIFTDGEL